jgi:hypothetical protein
VRYDRELDGGEEALDVERADELLRRPQEGAVEDEGMNSQAAPRVAMLRTVLSAQ